MDKVEAIAEPPVLSELVASNKAKIDEVTNLINPWIQANESAELRKALEFAPFDDIFIIRYILGNPNSSSKEIADILQETLQWRATRHDYLVGAAEGKCEALKPVYDHLCRGFLGEIGGHCMFVDRHGHNDTPHTSEMIKHYSGPDAPFELAEAFLMLNEFGFRRVDSLSRRTDRLCKVVSLSLMDNMSMKMSSNATKVMNAFGAASKKGAVLYPELLGMCVMFPSESMMMKVILKITRSVMSEATASKLVTCPGMKKGVSPNQCPALKKMNPNVDWDQALPACANGHGPLPPSLVSRRHPEKDEVKSS